MTENLRRRDDLKDLDTDGMILLKESWINMVVECGLESSDLVNCWASKKSLLHGVCYDGKAKDQWEIPVV
jgi:hypothetical protein